MKLTKELKEELNTILIKLEKVPNMENLKGINCFTGNIEEYEEYTSNKFKDLKPFLDKENELNITLANFAILKSVLHDILETKNETFNYLETSSFLSSGDY